MAHNGTVLSLRDWPVGCDPGFCVIWNRLRMIRWFSDCRPGEVLRVMRLIGLMAHGTWARACAPFIEEC